jgi:dolichol-phosphate mannosyltransferase
MVSWTGYRSIGIEFDRPERFGGTSKADTLGVLNNAINSILQSSQKVIRILPAFGIIVFIGSILLQVSLAANWLFRGVPFSGFGTIVSLILMSTGLTTLLFGLIGRYIWLIFIHSQNRPHFIVRVFLDSTSSSESPISNIEQAEKSFRC